MAEKPEWPALHRKVSEALELAEVGPEQLCDHPGSPCHDCIVDGALRLAVPIVMDHVRDTIASNLIRLGATESAPLGRLARMIRAGEL